MDERPQFKFGAWKGPENGLKHIQGFRLGPVWMVCDCKGLGLGPPIHSQYPVGLCTNHPTTLGLGTVWDMTLDCYQDNEY